MTTGADGRPRHRGAVVPAGSPAPGEVSLTDVSRRRESRARALWIAIASVVVAVLAAASIDVRALAAHAGGGPQYFTGARCAGAPDPAAAPADDPAVGLALWPSFQGGPLHNLALPGRGRGTALSASWRFHANDSIVMAPTVVGGVAYAGSMDGCVYALDVSSGRLIWSFPAANQVMSEPVVVGHRVFFGAGNKEMVRTPAGVVRGTGANGIYALDARTGRELWMYPTLGEDMPTPAYQDGVIYEATGDMTFYAVDAASGRLLWKLPVGSYVSMSSPTLWGDIAVFGGAQPYAIFGVNVRTHTLAWKVPLPQAESGVDDVTAAVADGVAYLQVPDGHYVKRIVEVAVRVADGHVLWRRTLGTDPFNVVQRALWQGDLRGHDGEEVGVATVAGGRVYVGTPAMNALWALDARTGGVLWRAALPDAVRTAPAVTADRVYAASDTRLMVLDRASGQLVRTLRLGSRTLGSGIEILCTTPAPTLVGDTLLVGGGLNSADLEAIPLDRLGG